MTSDAERTGAGPERTHGARRQARPGFDRYAASAAVRERAAVEGGADPPKASHPLLRSLSPLDARAVRTIAVSLALLVAVALLFVVGRTTGVFDQNGAPIFNWLKASADSPWGLPATIVVFTAAAFLGAPQMALMAGAVVAFGPVKGSIYSWIATIVSSAVTFELGRAFGAKLLRRYGGETANRLSRLVGRSGFWSSLVVRLVPSAPFIVVNMAAGVTHMSRLAFLSGTGIGIVAKIAMVAFLGGSLMTLAHGGQLSVALALGGVALGWLVAVVWARRALRARESGEHSGAAQDAVGKPGRT
jgi:uncharacterized membrane protein YdjX (TVP38/TMEM64 family)